MPRTSRQLHQLLESIRQGIAQGRWEAGAPLPSVRALAKQHDVSLNTVLRGLQRLEKEGLVDCQARRGTFVRPAAEARRQDARGRGRQIGLVSQLEDSTQPPDRHWTIRAGWGFHLSRALEAHLLAQGYQLTLLSYTADEGDPSARLLEAVDRIGHDLAGVVSFAFFPSNVLFGGLDRRDLPWVMMNRRDHRMTHNFVAVDNISLGRSVGRCCALMGLHRALVLQYNIRDTLSFFERSVGFYESFLLENVGTQGITPLLSPSVMEEGGYELTRAFLRENDPPQVIYATGDLMGFGAINACLDAGLDVPGDVAVVGSSGLEMGRYFRVPMTSVSQPMQQVGRDAAAMVLGMVQRGDRRVSGQFVPGDFLIRHSLVPPASIRSGLGLEVVDEQAISESRIHSSSHSFEASLDHLT